MHHFWVTLPNGSKDAASDKILADSNYSYAPTVSGPHTLHLEATAYDGTIIPTTYPFGVNQAAAAQTCYSFPAPAIQPISPFMPQIIRGDGTSFTWTATNLTDCFANSLVMVSNTSSNMIYNSSINYANGTLTVTGRVKTIGNNSMRFSFSDSGGRTELVDFYPPTVVDPQIVITNPYIKVSNDVSIQLLMDPAGATFDYLFTEPNSATFDSGTISNSSLYNLLAANKSQTGVYHIALSITGKDNITYIVPGAFAVHPDS